MSLRSRRRREHTLDGVLAQMRRNDLVLTLNGVTGIIETANPQASRMLGDVAGVHVNDLIPERARKEHDARRQEFMEGEPVRQMKKVTLLALDGAEIPVRVSLGRIGSQGVLVVLRAL